jgi:hypothetical protein
VCRGSSFAYRTAPTSDSVGTGLSLKYIRMPPPRDPADEVVKRSETAGVPPISSAGQVYLGAVSLYRCVPPMSLWCRLLFPTL